MRVSYVILTCNRQDDLRICLDSIIKQKYDDIEIVVIDNNSDEDSAYLIDIFPTLRYIRLNYNSGVCKGRNIGFEKATGDVIVVIDDDGELPHENVTQEIVDGFSKYPDMGIMALRVVNPKDPNCRRIIPSTDKTIANNDTETLVAYFLGGGVAIRKQVLDEVGLFPEQYFYSMEELDLAYRVAKTDWKIYYFPQVVILHHESLVQRPSWRKFYYEYRNRIWLATSYLPLPYLIVNLSIWGTVTFLKSLRYGHAKHFFKGTIDGLKDLKFSKERRKELLLNSQEIKRIKNLSGRLYY